MQYPVSLQFLAFCTVYTLCMSIIKLSLSLCLSHLSPHVSLCLSLSRTDFPTDICAYSSVFEQQCSVSQSASSLIPPSSSLSLSFSSLFPSSPKLSILPSLIINFYTMYTHYRKYTLKESGGRRNRYETDLWMTWTCACRCNRGTSCPGITRCSDQSALGKVLGRCCCVSPFSSSLGFQLSFFFSFILLSVIFYPRNISAYRKHLPLNMSVHRCNEDLVCLPLQEACQCIMCGGMFMCLPAMQCVEMWHSFVVNLQGKHVGVESHWRFGVSIFQGMSM